MSETRDIIVLGASYAGLGASHYILKHVFPKLPKGNIKYRLVLVDPSTKFYLRHASPRAAVSNELVPASKMFLDIEPGFKQYGDSFKFINGKATLWDPKARQVVVQKADGEEDILDYYALILATGTKTYSPLFSLQAESYLKNQKALDELHTQLVKAKSIIIAGGGPASVETAGEIGEALNGSAGWFSSQPAHPKVRITIITNSDKLLPVLRPSVAKQAETYLNRVGVDVKYNTKVVSATKSNSGKTVVMLHDGEEVVSDIYIPATGLRPMSEYAPAFLKNEDGYIKTNGKTLRVDEAGPRVYAAGDIGSWSNNSIMAILSGTPVLAKNLQNDLLEGHGKDREFTPNLKATQLVPVGRSKGVGEIFGWRVPSFFVWLIKGRDFMVDKSKGHVDGSNWAKES